VLFIAGRAFGNNRNGRQSRHHPLMVCKSSRCTEFISRTFGVAAPALATPLGLAALAGLAETYYAIRVGFDAALFHRLSKQAPPDLAALDAALVRLGLLPVSKSGRPLEQRIAGAKLLFYKQGAALVLQVALLLCGAAAALLSGASGG